VEWVSGRRPVQDSVAVVVSLLERIAGVTPFVLIRVTLLRVRREWAEVRGVAHAVAVVVRIDLVRGPVSVAVELIPSTEHAVAVEVDSRRVGETRRVVERVGDSVAVRVRRFSLAAGAAPDDRQQGEQDGGS
jgi:hypothetical protein